jgi:hypothetical protein
VILPGFARRLIASWQPPAGLSGAVTLDVTTNPFAHRSATINLGKDAAKRPQVEIVNLRAKSEHSNTLVSMTLVNTGTVAVAPAVTVLATQDGIERARTVLVSKEIAPGASVEMQWRPELNDGVYLITAQARSGDLLLDESSTGLRVGAAIGGQARARPARAPKNALAITASILLLFSAFWLAIAWRRRNNEDDEQQKPPHRLAA